MYMLHFIFLKGHPLHLAPSISWIRWFFWFFASVSRRRRSASALGATDQAMGSIGVEVSRLSPFRPAFRRRSASAFFFSSSNSCFFRSNKACRTFSAFKKKSPIRGSQSFFVVGWICQEKKYLKLECFSCLELYFVRLHLGDPTTCHLKKKVTDQQGYHLTTYSSHPSFAAPLTWPSQTRPPNVFQHVALPTISYPSWGRNHVIEYGNTMYSKCSLILSCHRCSSFPQRNSFLDDSCYAARFSWPNVNKQGGTHKKRVMQWCRMFAPHRSSRVLDRFYSPLFLFSPPLFFFSSFLLFRCI